MEIKLAIVGGRDFQNYRMLAEHARNVLRDMPASTGIEIVSGGAPGADTLAKKFANRHGHGYKEFEADWCRHGKKAGFIRNRQIVLRAHRVLAFWDGTSRGTKNTIDLALGMNKLLVVVPYKITQSEMF